MVEAREVSKHFGGTRALADASIAVRRGEIHGLVGRNGAGKSTLVGVLTGLVVPDTGEVFFDAKPAPAPGEREKWLQHVACVFQRPMVVPTLSIVENLFLGQLTERRNGLVSWSRLKEKARQALAGWNLHLDLDAKVAHLSVEERQIVEIVRALLRGGRFIILDEPTARLEAGASERLFAQIRHLRATAGVSFLYISHHLDELFELCDNVTVLRDGRKVETIPVASIDRDRLAAAMLGAVPTTEQRTIPGRLAARAAAADGKEPLLEIEELSLEGGYAGVCFTLRAGECVGVAGLIGSGKELLGDTVAGFIRPDVGTIRIEGRPLRPGRVDEAVRRGIGYVPDDRYARGFVPLLSVAENLTMPIWARLGRFGFVSPGRRDRQAARLISQLDIVSSSLGQPVGELSGGNQQKATLGRALAADPRVLVLMRPTSGVDIASKKAIFGSIRQELRAGGAVLVVSDEIDELQICDRVLVMHQGRITSEFGASWRQDDLIAAMEGSR